MSDSTYIEDVFREFYLRTAFSSTTITPGEMQAIENFNDLCMLSKPLTEKQSRYMIALLKKYRSEVCDTDFDYTSALADPKFRYPFRVIDETRRVFVEKQEDDLYLYVKFPYIFKETFEKEFVNDNNSKLRTTWDQDKQARYLDLFSVNLVWAQAFAEAHGFEIDSSMHEAVAATETAWENQDSILPYSLVEDGKVVIKNASDSMLEWFHGESNGVLQRDLLLAKIAGHCLKNSNSVDDHFAKISLSESNAFWIRDFWKFFDIVKTLDTKCCIIMDRTEDRKSWIEKFVAAADAYDVPRSDIKVCFREKGADDPFNLWIKEQGIGGKTEQGRMFIFEQKPAKWVFRHSREFRIIAVTSINPPMNVVTRDWLAAHPLGFYLTDIKPTEKGEKKIVEL